MAAAGGRARPGTATSTTSTAVTSREATADRRARRRRARTRGGGIGRRWHRDELLRLQGRLGNRLAAGRARGRRHTRSGCSCRRTSATARSSRSRASRSGATSPTTTRWPSTSRAPGAGSVVAIVATDAPLLPHQCAALARRVTTGIARTGTAGSHFSGDLFLALSTANPGAFPANHETLRGAGAERVSALRFVPWGAIDAFFGAVVQATEEAVLNALVANEEMTGFQGRRTPALPRDRVVELLAARSVR